MLFVDSHPDGLVLSNPDPGRRFRPSRGVARMLVVAVVLLMSAASAGLLALFLD
jgi:hypothetical protein